MSKEEKSIFWNMMSLWGSILVVIGHSGIAPDNIGYNSYAKFIHTWIYSFHMPLFAFLSGACFVEYSLKHYVLLEFIKNKLKRILLPYLWWILFVAVLSVIFSSVAAHNRCFDIQYFILCIVIPTKYSIVSYYWFLLVLFMIFIIAINIRKYIYTRKAACVVTVLLVLLNFINPFRDIEILCLYKLFDLLLYFWIGMLVAKFGIEKTIFSNKYFIATLLCTISIILNVFVIDNALVTMMLACVGIMFSVYLIRIIQDCGVKLQYRLSYSIYLLHGIVHKIPYILLRNVQISWWEHLIVFALVGIFVPVFIVYLWKRIHLKSCRLFLGE